MYKNVDTFLKILDREKDEVDFVELFHDQNDELIYIKNEENIGNGSVDIMIQLKKFWIIIENKIKARETSNQSIRYEKYGEKQNIPIKYITRARL